MIRQTRFFFVEDSAFDMLYDLAQDNVERFIIMPFLASIYDNEGDEDKYWIFLTKGYFFGYIKSTEIRILKSQEQNITFMSVME